MTDNRFSYATPESCGISSAKLEKMLRKFDDHGFATHSILMAKGDRIFLDAYWHPFNSETHHRMNSVTKSFVGIAIGLLEEEGRISLNDKVSKYFPDECPADLDGYTKDLTIRNLLEMRTTSLGRGGHWVRDGILDRKVPWFISPAQRPRDTLFHYDSTGSFMLCVIVERLTGKTFVEYLMDKMLRKIGFSEKTECIKGPDGYSWGDSGLLCRPHDLLAFAQLINNGGVWKSERLMNEEFLRKAVSKISDTCEKGTRSCDDDGYGYQIWRYYNGEGFMFLGAGDQIMVCIPDKDFYFVCTGDNQEHPQARAIICDTLTYDIINELSDTPLPEDEKALCSLNEYTSSLKLCHIRGNTSSHAAKVVNKKTYTLSENKMGIKWFKLRLDEQNKKGIFEYENAQGHKELEFGLCENVLTEFPEEGYPKMQMNVPAPGNKYPCASSGAWLEERKLGIRVMMTGDHLGGLFITIGFSDDYSEVGMYMHKNTNCFLHTYAGYAGGTLAD